jgi:hypothetical protein
MGSEMAVSDKGLGAVYAALMAAAFLRSRSFTRMRQELAKWSW